MKFKPPHWFFLGLAIALVFGIIFFSIKVLSQQPVHVSVLIQALEGTQWRPAVAAFEAENPDIKLDVVEGPNATNLVEDLYTTSFLLGNSPYDLVYMDVIWVPKFAAAGWLQDLSDFVANEDLSDFLDANLEAGRYQGGLYQIPLRSDGGMLYFRTDLLEQIGRQPPKTFEELLEISQILKQQGLVDWGYLWQGKQYEGLAAMFVEILQGYGGFWVDPETLEVGLDYPEAIQALQFLKETVNQGISPPGVTTYQEDEARRLFENEGAAFMRNWPYAWALGNAESSAVRGKFGIKPMVHAAGFQSGACLGGWGLGIAKTSKHPEAAWRVIQYFSSTDAQREFVLQSGYVPSRKSLFTDAKIVEKFHHYPDLLQVIENAVLRPPIAQYAQASDILQRYVSAALSGRSSIEKAMRSAAGETRRLFGRERR
jgi:multiple sugar transport system substrate-binding protein